MAKIGILTYHFANNYGAVLQAFSMQRILSDIGYESVIIDYASLKQRSNNSFFEYYGVEAFIKNIIRFPHILSRKKRINKFKLFRKNRLNISAQKFYTTKHVLSYLNSEFDCVIVGSDQVWNPKVEDFDDFYFLVSSCAIPTLAFSASTGDALNEDIEKYKQDIMRFSFVGVREAASVNMLKKLCCKDVYHVFDPVLIIGTEDLHELSVPCESKDEPYILCYFLGREFSNQALIYMDRIKEIIGIPYICINANYGIASYKKEMLLDVGPEDFVSLIANASCVFTNSFHAIAISIKLHVPFYDIETNLNDYRKRGLLSELGLEDRIIKNFEVLDNYNLDSYDICQANELLSIKADDSLKMLRNALKKQLEKE